MSILQNKPLLQNVSSAQNKLRSMNKHYILLIFIMRCVIAMRQIYEDWIERGWFRIRYYEEAWRQVVGQVSPTNFVWASMARTKRLATLPQLISWLSRSWVVYLPLSILGTCHVPVMYYQPLADALCGTSQYNLAKQCLLCELNAVKIIQGGKIVMCISLG